MEEDYGRNSDRSEYTDTLHTDLDLFNLWISGLPLAINPVTHGHRAHWQRGVQNGDE